MLPELPSDVRILVIDDVEPNLALLRQLLGRAGCSDITLVADSRLALGCIRDLHPDLVILDLHMPHVSGVEVLEALAVAPWSDPFLPVLVITGDIGDETRHVALALGARDFLTKPFDTVEVVLRARNLIESRRLLVAQRDQNEILEARVRERTRELELAQAEILDKLALAGDFRDDVTGAHARRVGQIAGLVAAATGLPAAERLLIEMAAPLHDIGKIALPDAVLLKPGKLTPDEFEQVRTHVRTGHQLLDGSRFPVLQRGAEVALLHHERWDGGGYLGVSGGDIPMAARVVSIADVFDALTHARPYKHAWPIPEALQEIASLRARAFDPQIVDAFMSLGFEHWTTERLDGLGRSATLAVEAA